MYQNRTYRNQVHCEKMLAFQIMVKETDLLVHAEKNLECETRELVIEYRGYVEAFIEANPGFIAALAPWHLDGPAPTIVMEMVEAGEKAGVGPMAAIAGAIAERTGLGLLKLTDHVIVENGGDVFIKTNTPVTVGIFAGESPLSLHLGLRVNSRQEPVAVCTSSGTVGHSLSFGKADAVCVVADSCSIADAAATSIGNRVHSTVDIEHAIAEGKRIERIQGIIIIVDEKIGIWGDLEVVPLNVKKS